MLVMLRLSRRDTSNLMRLLALLTPSAVVVLGVPAITMQTLLSLLMLWRRLTNLTQKQRLSPSRFSRIFLVWPRGFLLP